MLSDRIVMMTNGPNATSARCWRWTCAARDRLALASEPRFLAARERCCASLHDATR